MTEPKYCLALDLDGVLINRNAFKNYLMNTCSDEGIDPKKFLVSYDANKSIYGYYKLDDHLKTLASYQPLAIRNLRHAVTKACFGKSFPVQQMIYPDAAEFLEKMAKKYGSTIDLMLISRGDPEFQKLKLLATKINRYFKETFFVSTESKGSILVKFLDQYRKVVFVDDNFIELSDAEKFISSNWRNYELNSDRYTAVWLTGKISYQNDRADTLLNCVSKLDQIPNLFLFDDWVI